MKTYKKMLVISFLMVVILACTTEGITPETGTIDIKLTVGPLCPVEPCNKSMGELKQIYESYSFVISNPITKSIVSEQKVVFKDNYGGVKSNLTVGEYELDITPKTIFTKQGFPKTVVIEKNKVTELDISIDTGIR